MRRLTTTRLLAATTGTLIAVLLLATPAWADLGDPVGCDHNPANPHCDVEARNNATYVDVGGGTVSCRDGDGREVPCHIPDVGWRGSDGCYYRQVPPEEVLPALAVDQLSKETMTTGVWLLRRCPLDDDFTDFTTGWYEWRAEGTPPGLFDMVEVAVSRLAPPPPQIALSPPPPAPQLVWLPTWMWIDESTWSARSATASVPGVTVTATATPGEVTWSMGDGEFRTCQGAGTPWSNEFDARASSPTCGYTYTRPSHRQTGGVYELRATVTWQISWQAGGLEGTVSPLTTTSVASVEVVESLARNTGGQR